MYSLEQQFFYTIYQVFTPLSRDEGKGVESRLYDAYLLDGWFAVTEIYVNFEVDVIAIDI